MFCELYYMPSWLEVVKNLSPTLAGLGMMPITGGVILTSACAGAVMTKFGRFSWVIWSGWTVTIISTSCMIILDENSKTHEWVPLLIAVGIGHGLIMPSLNIGVQALADSADVGYATAMYVFLRTLGMCLGVPIGGTVFQNRLNYHLSSLGHLSGSVNAEAVIPKIKNMPMDSPTRQAINSAYAKSFQNVCQVLTGIAVLGGVVSLFMFRRQSLASRKGSDRLPG